MKAGNTTAGFSIHCDNTLGTMGYEENNDLNRKEYS